MRLLFSIAFLFALSPGEAVKLTFAPEEGAVLKRTFEATADYHLADVSLSIDGEPMEDPGEIPEFNMHFVEKIAVTDEISAVSGGRPTELKRRFDELKQETTLSGAGDEDRESSSSSDLEGRSVRFRWNEDDEKYAVAAADDEELSSDLADCLIEDMDLRAVLPDHEVEAGDEWELEPQLYLAFMWPSGLLDFRDEGQEEVSDEDRAMNQETVDRLEGSGTARLEELKEEDGVQVAVIHVELEIKTGCDSLQEGEEQDVNIEVEIEREVSGTILWDVEHGHALSAELEAHATRVTTRSGKVETEDGEIALEETESLEGTIHYGATIERE